MDVTLISHATDVHRRRSTVSAERRSGAIVCGSSGVRGVFKKSRTAADLQRAGRDVAKDPDDIASIASLTKSLDQSDRSEAVFSARGRISAESLPTVPGTSHHCQMLVRRTVRHWQIGMAPASGSAANCDNPINLNLTAVAGAGRPTARMLRQTNNSSGPLCKSAGWVGSAFHGVVIPPGVSHEKYGYAGV